MKKGAVAAAVALAIAAGLAMRGAALAAANEVDVFLTGGQSNTDGRLDGSTLPGYLKEANAKALVSAHGPLDEKRLGVFAPFHPASGEPGQPGKWAYDAELYYHLAKALGKEFYVIKTSFGGTSITPKANNSPSGHPNAWLENYGAGYHWSVDEAFLEATVSAGRTFENFGKIYDGQSMLKAWIENIDAGLDAIAAAGKKPVVKAIIWHQGESDKHNGAYAKDLTAVVEYVRNHVAAKLGDEKYKTLPFFCGSIPRKSSLHTATTDRAFEAIEADAGNNMHVVDLYDLTLKSDNIHFDAEGSILFGRRLYNRMIDEGVISGAKLEVAKCVREADFGAEHVVNNTTTWTWADKSGDVATELTDVDGMYFHGKGSNSRKFQVVEKFEKKIEWTLGEAGSFTTKKGVYSNWNDASGNITLGTTAGAWSGRLGNTAAVNVGRAGAFEAFIVTGKTGKAKLLCNGKTVDEKESAAPGTLLHLKGTNAGKAVYYIIAPGASYLFAARYVPAEEMPAVTLEIGESGWGTFGNLYEANFALPEGVKAYAVGVRGSTPDTISLFETGALNIGEAVVVNGKPGTYTLVSGTGCAKNKENLMTAQKAAGVIEPTSGNDFFNFVQGADAAGNCVFTRADGSLSLAAGKAFFSITEGDGHARQQKLTCRVQANNTKKGKK